MPVPPEQLLRYLFDSPAQARRHLHSVERRQLLFFPHLFCDLREGQPVLLEVSFTGSEQTLTARGEVRSVETGALRGAWLEVYSSRPFEGAFLSSAPRRLHRRLPANLIVRAGRPGLPASMARITDLSAGGLRLAGMGGSWATGETLTLTTLGDGLVLFGKVVRAQQGELAVQLIRSDATTRRNGVKLVEAILERWKQAREARHPPACTCMNGGALFEPLLPRAAHRRAEGV